MKFFRGREKEIAKVEQLDKNCPKNSGGKQDKTRKKNDHEVLR